MPWLTAGCKLGVGLGLGQCELLPAADAGHTSGAAGMGPHRSLTRVGWLLGRGQTGRSETAIVRRPTASGPWLVRPRRKGRPSGKRGPDLATAELRRLPTTIGKAAAESCSTAYLTFCQSGLLPPLEKKTSTTSLLIDREHRRINTIHGMGPTDILTVRTTPFDIVVGYNRQSSSE